MATESPERVAELPEPSVRYDHVVTDTDVRRRLEAEGLVPVAWSNGPGDRYPVHRHGYDKVVAVERGSIVFGLPLGEPIYLGPGDRLELPAGTDHDAVVGPDGVTCLEAHLAAGTLQGLRRRQAGHW